MAKTDEPGSIERHIEKIVLAGTVVILALVLVLWVVQSPRRIELDGSRELKGLLPDSYPPTEVDAQLKRRGDALRQVVAEAAVTSTPPPDWPGDLAGLFNTPYNPDDMRGTVVWDSGRKAVATGTVDPEAPKVKLADLIQAMPAPEAPKLNVVHEVVIVPERDPATNAMRRGYRETQLSHGAFVFSHGELLKGWRAILEKPGIRIPSVFAVASVQVERQRRIPGGAWGSGTVIRTVRRAPLQLPAIPVYTGTNRDEVRKVVIALADDRWVKAILEPEFHEIYDPERSRSWQENKPITRVGKLITTTTAMRRPGVRPGVRPVVNVPRPYIRGGDPMMGPTILDPYARPGGAPVPRPATGAGAGAVATPTVPAWVVPSMRQQLDNVAGILEVWFHDMDLGAGTEYRYRVRLTLFNPLLGFAQEAANADDAKVATLATKWSPWSEPVAVKRLTEFFVMSAVVPLKQAIVKRDPYVNVVVFTRRWGRVVRDTFKVHRGEAIGAERVHQVMPPGGAAEPQETKISFETGAVLVDFDAKRKIRPPNSPFDTTTTEAVYLDAEGNLRTRLWAFDKASARHTELAAAAKRATGQQTPTPDGRRLPEDPRYRDPRYREDPRRVPPDGLRLPGRRRPEDMFDGPRR